MNKDEQDKFLSLMSLRKRANLTQKELATRLEAAFGRSVTVQTVSAWERGIHQPRLTPEETLVACEILNCTLIELAKATKKRLLVSEEI